MNLKDALNQALKADDAEAEGMLFRLDEALTVLESFKSICPNTYACLCNQARDTGDLTLADAIEGIVVAQVELNPPNSPMGAK